MLPLQQINVKTCDYVKQHFCPHIIQRHMYTTHKNTRIHTQTLISQISNKKIKKIKIEWTLAKHISKIKPTFSCVVCPVERPLEDG